MKKKVHLLLGLLIPCFAATAQNYVWGGTIGGDGEDVVLSLHADSAGNTYTTGYFTNNCDFDPTPGGISIISTGNEFDIFVQKTNTDGTLAWAKKMGGPLSDNGTKITTDAAGNVYVTGVFQGTADFDPGDAVFNLTSAGGLDIFIVKLTAEGDFVWAKNFSGTEYEESNGIGTDSEGNVYISGYFYNPVDFDPGSGMFTMTPAGSGDGFAVKLSPDGDFIWAKSFGGPDFDLATGMVVKNDNVYISGNFTGTGDFNPGDEEFLLTTPENTNGIFLVQLNSDGDFVKAVKAGQCNNEVYGYSVAVNNNGAAYIGGYFGNDLIFSINGTDTTFTSSDYYNSFVVKIDADGSIAWAKHLNSSMLCVTYSIAVNTANEAIVSGYFNGTLTMDGITLTKQNTTDSESYVAKLDSQGNFISARQFGGINFIDRCAVSTDDNNNIYLAGAFEGSVDINPTPNQENIVTSAGFRDNYIIKLDNQALSVARVLPAGSVTVYPVPSSDFITINSVTPFNNDSYTIYDMAGRQVSTGRLTDRNQASLESLSPGVYTIQINAGAYKIIKE